MVKVTFTLDAETVDQIRRTAARQRKPQSQIVREAVAEYAARADRLTERERLQLLETLGHLAAARPTRSARAVDLELRDLRAARRQGGRRS
jgi:hypothetical protein